FVSRLGDYETGRLSRRRHTQVQEHLDQCDHCPALVAEMTAASERLGVLLLPVLLLAPKALWWVFGGWAVKAGFLLWGAKAGLTRLREPKVAAGSAGGVAVAGIVAAVAVAAVLPPDPGTEPAPPAATASAGEQPSPAPASSPSAEPDRSAAPEPPPQTQPPTPAPQPPSQPALPAAPPEPAPPAQPSQQPAPPAETPSPPPETDAPTAIPEPTTSPSPEPPAPSAPPAPQVTGPESGNVYTTLALSGQEAVPGATITVRDDAGNEVATTTADESGQWQTNVGYTPPGGESSGGGTSGTGGGKSLGGRMLLAAVAAAQENEDEADDGGASPGPEGSRESDGSDSGGLGNSGEGNSGEGESGEPGAEMDTDALLGPARTYTVTQTVPEGASENYSGESDPKTIGPIHWRAPE